MRIRRQVDPGGALPGHCWEVTVWDRLPRVSGCALPPCLSVDHLCAPILTHHCSSAIQENQHWECCDTIQRHEGIPVRAYPIYMWYGRPRHCQEEVLCCCRRSASQLQDYLEQVYPVCPFASPALIIILLEDWSEHRTWSTPVRTKIHSNRRAPGKDCPRGNDLAGGHELIQGCVPMPIVHGEHWAKDIELGATNARGVGRLRWGNLRGGCMSKLCVQ